MTFGFANNTGVFDVSPDALADWALGRAALSASSTRLLLIPQKSCWIFLRISTRSGLVSSLMSVNPFLAIVFDLYACEMAFASTFFGKFSRIFFCWRGLAIKDKSFVQSPAPCLQFFVSRVSHITKGVRTLMKTRERNHGLSHKVGMI